MTKFHSSAKATKTRQASRSNALFKPITGKRSSSFVRPLKSALSRLREQQQPDTRSLMPFGYGMVKVEPIRAFREIDSQGRLQTIEVLSGDQIDGVVFYAVQGSSKGIIYPGSYLPGGTDSFPGNLRDNGTINDGRYSGNKQGRADPNGSIIRLFAGTQQQPDQEMVSRTGLGANSIGRGISYLWTQMVFQEGRFDGDPTYEAVIRARKCVDPRDVTINSTFDLLPKQFSINPYIHIFDYLVRPTERGGLGVPVDLIDATTFGQSATWSEAVVDSVQFSATAVLTTRTNQNTGTPPVNTNHILEFEESICPFEYGDVVQINLTSGQSAPSNLSTNTNYFVIPIRPLVGDFQFPGIALAASLEDSLQGISIPQGTRTTDITVTKVGEVRFQSSVSYVAGEDILESLLESCGANLFLNDGRIAITQQSFPDEQDIETVDLGELIGPFAISTSLDPDERVTGLSGSFRSVRTLFQETAYPTVTGGGLFQQQDNDEAVIGEFDLPNTPKASIANRLATVRLRRLRQETSVAFSGDLSLLRLKPNTVFSMEFPKYRLDSQTTFEVRSQTVALSIDNDVPSFSIDIEARQLESTTYDLDATNEEFLASADIPGLSSPFEVSPPGTPEIEEALFRTRPGAGVRASATLTWLASPSLFVTRYEVSFKKSSATVFTFQTETPDTTITITDLEPGFYDFRVVAINSIGRRSNPEDAEVTNFQIAGLSARPSALTNFTGGVIGAAHVQLQWDRSTDLDVLQGGSIEIRHDPAVSGAVARDSVFLREDTGSQTTLSLPFAQGTYFLRAQDSSGQFSDPVSWSTQDRRPVDVAQIPVAGVLTDTGGFTLQEDNTFPSTDPNNTLIFVTDHLELPLEDTLDDEADFDAIADMDTVGGGSVSPSGLYFFSTDVELSEARRVLVEAVISAEVFDLTASLDDEADFDQIPNVDSVAAALLEPGLVTSEIQVRFSQGTVASDTFGPWEPIITQFIQARSFQFRVLARSFSPTANTRITQARVRMRDVPL